MAMRSGGRLFAAASRLVRQGGTSVTEFRVSEIGAPSSRLWNFRFVHASAPLFGRYGSGISREEEEEEAAAFRTLMNTELDRDFLKLPDTFRRKWGYNRYLPLEIYKRACYDALVPWIMSYFDVKGGTGVVLTGTPGIGKTGFLWYLLWYILKYRQEDIVLAVHGLYYILRRKDGSLEVKLAENVNAAKRILEWGSRRPWLLADTLVPEKSRRLDFNFLLTCSPRKSNSGEFKKECDVRELYVPVWTEEELCRLGQRVFGLNLQDIKEKFDKWGGIPSFVLAKVKPAEQEVLLRAIRLTAQQELTRIGFNEHLVAIPIPENLSHKVFHCMPVGDDYTRFRHILGSSYIVEELLKMTPGTVLERFLHEKVDGQLLDIQTSLWDKYVLRYLELGGDLQMRKLSGKSKSSGSRTTTFPAAKRIHRAEYTYITLIREGGQTWKYDKMTKQKVGDPIADPGENSVFGLELPVLPNTVTDETLICPLSRTNAHWDAIRGKAIFLSTVKPVKADSLQMVETLRFLHILRGKGCEIEFVYVVPRFIYPTFTLESMSTDLEKRNVELSVATIPSKPLPLPEILQDLRSRFSSSKY